MSLLLDALKKAAEQKAEKSKEDLPPAQTSDQTVVEAEELSELGAAAAQRPMQDETELDNSELNSRLEHSRVERTAGEDTRLEAADQTEAPGLSAQLQSGEDTRLEASDQTQTPGLSAQMQTGEDETIIFAEDDVADFMGESEPAKVDRPAPEDETDLSQLASAGDETDVSAIAAEAVIADRDDTDISKPFAPADQTDIPRPIILGDETDISQPVTSVADLVHAAEQRDAAAEETDLSRSSADDTGASDDDVSLLLVEREQTNINTRSSLTDPQLPQDQIQALQSNEDLALVDTTQHRPDQTATQAQTQSSAPTSIADTQSTHGAITTRADSTSTRTYAPDNYDRTLMRLPSDDASKLFAGMKSDSDVVMTPDYAKKVFRSKSSAQRLQHYKIYSGIAIVILLSIGIYGAFEYQDESDNIDANLASLKRDPMPGIIKPGDDRQSTSLFAESEAKPDVDARTLELIEGAEGVAGADLNNSAEAEVEVVEAPVNETSTALEASTPAAADPAPGPAAVVAEPSSGGTSTAVTTQTPVKTTSQAVASDNQQSALEITSNSQVEKKHVWLREAYQAYESGDDKLALQRYNQVLRLDPGNRNALLARAAIKVQNNDSRAAISDYQTLLLANPKDSLAMTSLITVANYSPQETESQLKLMIRDEPDSPYLNFALANAYGAQDRWTEAQSHYFRALENNPGDPNYAYNLAVSLEHIAQPKAAIPYYRRALANFDKGLATFNRDLVDQRLEKLGKL